MPPTPRFTEPLTAFPVRLPIATRTRILCARLIGIDLHLVEPYRVRHAQSNLPITPFQLVWV